MANKSFLCDTCWVVRNTSIRRRILPVLHFNNTQTLLMSHEIMLVWLPVHLLYSLCSHLAVLTHCWELWKSRHCSLTNCFSLLMLSTCWHVCLCNSSPLYTSVRLSLFLPTSAWSRLISRSLLHSLFQPYPTSSSSEVSETGQLHGDCSSPSSLAAATAPQHATDKVKHTQPL